MDRLPAPKPGKRAYYYDSKSRGLVIDVTPNGVKTFRVYRKVQGKPERILVGRYPDVSIEQARGAAHELNARIARGENPALKARGMRAEMLFGELFDLYIERHAKLEKRSWSGDVWLHKKYFADWDSRRLSSIQRDDIERRKAAVAKLHGRYSANRVLALLNTVFAKAAKCGSDLLRITRELRKQARYEQCFGSALFHCWLRKAVV